MVDVTPKLNFSKKSFSPKHQPNEGDGETVINGKTFRESIPSTTLTETLYETEGDESFSGDSPTQHFIDESMHQFADMTKEEDPAFNEYLEQFAELPKMYFKEGIKDTKQQFDHRFGVYHYLETDAFSIGETNITFDGEDLIIKGVRYKGLLVYMN